MYLDGDRKGGEGCGGEDCVEHDVVVAASGTYLCNIQALEVNAFSDLQLISLLWIFTRPSRVDMRVCSACRMARHEGR